MTGVPAAQQPKEKGQARLPSELGESSSLCPNSPMLMGLCSAAPCVCQTTLDMPWGAGCLQPLPPSLFQPSFYPKLGAALEIRPSEEGQAQNS